MPTLQCMLFASSFTALGEPILALAGMCTLIGTIGGVIMGLKRGSAGVALAAFIAFALAGGAVISAIYFGVAVVRFYLRTGYLFG